MFGTTTVDNRLDADAAPWLAGLNDAQRQAVEHDGGPLLVLAGAGTGKTTTLACRVARLVADGVPPERLLLLTFTRRAAHEMLQRADRCLARSRTPAGRAAKVVGGTFHAVANRLLRRHGEALGLGGDFGILDQPDAADLLDLVRDDLYGGTAIADRPWAAEPPGPGERAAQAEARTGEWEDRSRGSGRARTRFPRKATLAAIYSRTVNARTPLDQVLDLHFPWCRQHAEALATLFRAYTARKRAQRLLDYDDLLLWWHALVTAPGIGPHVAAGFDHVLVDEYQDTNPLQAEIVEALRRDDDRVTVVGDDAQAIYAFRAATVSHILAFPQRFPGATVVRLEQSYRATQPLLDAANAVIAAAPDGDQFPKALWSTRDGARPRLHTCFDEAEQSERVCRTVLARREQGVALREQAVLFRTGHHSAHLEVELTRRGIPFVKYGGLKYLEAAHVKDLLAVLRLLDNPDDELAWFRVLQLLEGVGPAGARQLMRSLGVGEGGVAVGRLLAAEVALALPAAARDDVHGLATALRDCGAEALDVAGQIERIARWYEPVCARVHGDAEARIGDLAQLAVLATGTADRTRFLDDLVLDPPASTGDLAGPPLLDEDWLVLSTIHSAKGLEWDTVQLLHATDGMLPSDMATGRPEDVAEERRLLYVALTRARQEVDVYAPLRYYHSRFGSRDAHGYAQLSRFLAPPVRDAFDRIGPTGPDTDGLHGAFARGRTDGAAAVDGLLDGLFG